MIKFCVGLWALVSGMVGASMVMFIRADRGHPIQGIIVGCLLCLPQMYIILDWIDKQEKRN